MWRYEGGELVDGQKEGTGYSTDGDTAGFEADNRDWSGNVDHVRALQVCGGRLGLES